MIRLYQPQDTDNVIEAWRQASLIAHPFLSVEFMAEEADNLRNLFLPNSDTWVYELDGQVAGFLSLHGNEVGGLFVHPAFQRKGIGGALMNKAASLHPTLELEVFEANPIGRSFYARYGFVEIARVTDEATGLPALRLRYVRDVSLPAR